MKAFLEINQKEGSEEKFYWVFVLCRNCGFKSEVAILRGTPIRDTECPKCETKSLELYKEPKLKK